MRVENKVVFLLFVFLFSFVNLLGFDGVNTVSFAEGESEGVTQEFIFAGLCLFLFIVIPLLTIIRAVK